MTFQKLEVLIGEIHRININMERLQKVIASAGITSRRKAEQMILDGRVKVNGEVITQLGFKVSSKDEVMVDDIKIKKEEKVYYLLNKPKKCVCTVKDEHDRTTVLDYMSDVKERIFPVGRLDYDTTGVLILTNDGEFANQMMHPRNHFPKTYRVTIDGLLSDEEAHQLRKGIELEDGLTLPASVHIEKRNYNKNRTIFMITIFEGRNREIKRMMEYFGYEVIRLNRIQYGTLTVKDLRQGEYRRLRSYEIKELLKEINKNQ